MIISLVLSLLLTGGEAAAGQPPTKPPDPCITAVPGTVSKKLRDFFPEWSVVHTRLLSRDDRRQFTKRYPTSCAGVVSGDFFGDGTDAYAVLLTRLRGDRRQILIAVARRLKPDSDPWLQIVDGYDDNRLRVPLLVSGDPGEYESVYRDHKLTARWPVFHLVGGESVEIVFVWTGSYFGRIWLAD
jgi:hypothetical protein